MIRKLLGELVASPARIVEAGACVTDNLTDGALRDFGLEDIKDLAEHVGDSVSEGIEEAVDG